MKKLFFPFLFFLAQFTLSIFSCNAQFTLWGMTSLGGTYNDGVIFKYDPQSNSLTNIFDFHGQFDGKNPTGSLLLAYNNKFYGMTSRGGGADDGILFEYDPINDSCSVLFTFILTDMTYGAWPYGSLIEDTSGDLYGMTLAGGSNLNGTIIEYNIDNNIINSKFNFGGVNGWGPYGSLIKANNGLLYGLTQMSQSNKGVLFSYNISTSTYTKIISFNGTSNGAKPTGSLIQANNGKLYGLTQEGGIYNYGVLFEYDISGSLFSKKVDFDSIYTGWGPSGTLIQATNGKLYGTTVKGGMYNNGVLFEYDIALDTLINLFDFDSINGRDSYGSLMQASNGKIYGMTKEGGTNDFGVIFEYDLNLDSLTKKIDFDSIHGSFPVFSNLIEVPDSLLTNSEFLNKKNDIRIYPNPSDGYLTITTEEKNILSIDILNIIGEVVFTIKSIKPENNVILNVPSGLYIIRIKTSNGFIQEKLLIEK